MFKFLFGAAFGAAAYWAWESFGKDLFGMGDQGETTYGGFSSPSTSFSSTSPSSSLSSSSDSGSLGGSGTSNASTTGSSTSSPSTST
jgi:hypothetical protein